MAPPSKLLALPEDVRRRLDALIVERGFGDYAALAEWLADRGCPVHKTTVARYGKALRRRLERVGDAARQARAMVAEPGDPEMCAEGAARQIQARIFEILRDADGADMNDLLAAARTLAETARVTREVRRERRAVLADADRAARPPLDVGMALETLLGQAVGLSGRAAPAGAGNGGGGGESTPAPEAAMCDRRT